MSEFIYHRPMINAAVRALRTCVNENENEESGTIYLGLSALVTRERISFSRNIFFV